MSEKNIFTDGDIAKLSKVLAFANPDNGNALEVHQALTLDITEDSTNTEILDGNGRPDVAIDVAGTKVLSTTLRASKTKRRPLRGEIFTYPRGVTTVAASATIDAALVLTAIRKGRWGNDLNITLVDPGAADQALSISEDLSTYTWTVSLATDGIGDISSTYAQVKALLEDATESVLPEFISVGYKDPEDGTSVAVAVAQTYLSGGASGKWRITSSNPSQAEGATAAQWSLSAREVLNP